MKSVHSQKTDIAFLALALLQDKLYTMHTRKPKCTVTTAILATASYLTSGHDANMLCVEATSLS